MAGIPQVLASTFEEDRHRNFERRAAVRRGVLETSIWRPALVARLAAASWRLAHSDTHSLTSYPCRLPDGKIGRTAVVMSDGQWTFVCRIG